MAFFKIENKETIQEGDFQTIYEPEQSNSLFRAWLIDPKDTSIQSKKSKFRAFEFVFRTPEYCQEINEQIGHLFKLSILKDTRWDKRNDSVKRDKKIECVYKFSFMDGQQQILTYENALQALSIILGCSCDYPAICFYAPGEMIESWSLKIPQKYLVIPKEGRDDVIVKDCYAWFRSEIIRTMFKVGEQFFSSDDLEAIKAGKSYPLHSTTIQKCLKQLREQLAEKNMIEDLVISEIKAKSKSFIFSTVPTLFVGWFIEQL